MLLPLLVSNDNPPTPDVARRPRQRAIEDWWILERDIQQRQRRPLLVELPGKPPFSRGWFSAVERAWILASVADQRQPGIKIPTQGAPPGPPVPDRDIVCYPRQDLAGAGFSRMDAGATAYTKDAPIAAFTREPPPGFTGTRLDAPVLTRERLEPPDCDFPFGYGDGYGDDYGGTA